MLMHTRPLPIGHAPVGSAPRPAVQPYRACELCLHGLQHQGERVCTCRAVVAPAAHMPVALVRRPHGPCGPEALHLDFAGLRP